jgi:hypothetical protein
MFNLKARWDVQALKLSQARNAVQYNVSTVEIRGLRPLIGLVSPGTEYYRAIY